MPTLYEGLGTEEVVDIIDVRMRVKLAAAIDYQNDLGRLRDQARATQLGSSVVSADAEHVPTGNFHVGDLPSFVGVRDRLELYPLLAVVPGRTIPDAEDPRSDQFNVYQNAINIHSFARANPNEGSEVAYRRASRMAEAVHQVVVTDRELRRVLAGVSGPLMVDRSETFFFPMEDDHDVNWCWRAIMHSYQIKNYSKSPMEV